MKTLRILALSVLAACVLRAQPTPPTPDTSTLTTNGSNQIQQSFIVGSGKSITINGGSLALGYTTIATAAGTTTLTVSSTPLQYFTGSTTQTVKLPVTSTLLQGQSYTVVNNSTGAVTVQSSGANTITILAGNTSATFTCILTSGTTASSWQALPAAVIVASGKALTVSNSLTLAGTDGTTMTFPGTSATIARTDAANTFTGHQTIEGVTSTGATGTGNLVFATAPTLGAVTATSVNGNTLTAGTYTLTGTAAKTLTFNNSLTFAGTDGTTMTFPGVSGTVDTIAGTQTLTNKTFDTASNTFNFNGNTMSGGSVTGGTYESFLPILVATKSVTMLTAATPASLGTVVLPAGITRWMTTTSTSLYCYAETASGTLAAGTIQVRTAAAGGGTQLWGTLTPPASAGTITTQLGSSNSMQTATTLFLWQTGNSANTGTISLYFLIYPAL